MLEEFVASINLTPVSDAVIMSVAQQLQNTAELIELGLYVEPNIQVPDDNCCYLYDKENFGGDNIELCMASNETYSKFYLPDLDFNDKAESVLCGKKIDIQICKDGFYKCD